jgi:D-alanine-D-alanine ligase
MLQPVKVGVVFGGRSVEHEVSVITAQQAIAALPKDRFVAVPVYIAKSGVWYTGPSMGDVALFADIEKLIAGSTAVAMRPDPQGGGALFEATGRRGLLSSGARALATFDVAMPLVHGSHGEDGTLQGLFELSDVAYTGCGVAAAATSMDKPLAKAAMRAAGLPVLDYIGVDRDRWRAEREGVCADIVSRFAFPIYVKPRSLGSSIGVARVESREQLVDALDLALTYDVRALAEAAQEGIVEINCSVLGRGSDVRVSVCEQPASTGMLSYSDKYLSKSGTKSTGMKGAQRLIPAPLPEALTKRIQNAAVAAFAAIDAEGVARVDFLVRPDSNELIVNEINTVPGSLSFYLWEHSGLAFPDLLAELVTLALQRHGEKRQTTFSIDTWLLSGRPGR